MRKRKRKRKSNDKIQTCSFPRCNRQPDVIVVIHGIPRPICRKHFRYINKKLEKLAMKKGVAKLDDLKIKFRRT